MTAAERDPTPDELAAMAYADGELAPQERRAFEERMAASPALSRDVVQYQRLQALASHAAPPEPMDHEWKRLTRDPLQRASLLLGWALLISGAVGLFVWAGVAIVESELVLLARLALGAVLAGGALLGLGAVRARLRTRPYDSYTEVQR